MKFGLNESYFSVRYETFYNDDVPIGETKYDRCLLGDKNPKTIFEVALVKDRKGNIVEKNDFLCPGKHFHIRIFSTNFHFLT